MKKLVLKFLFFLSLSSFAQEDIPQLTEIVTDNAQIFSIEETQQLKNKLTQFESKTSNQVVVLTVKNLSGYSVEHFANLTFNQNKLGQEGYDNGLLIVFSENDRKVRIEVGRGLEPYITDALSSRIIRNTMIPEFKNENYFRGINLATDEVIHYLENPEAIKEFEASLEEEKQKNRSIGLVFGSIFLSIFILVGIVFFSFLYKNLLKIYREILVGKLGVLEGSFASCFIGFFSILPLAFVILPIGIGLTFFYDYDFEEPKWLAQPYWIIFAFIGYLCIAFLIAYFILKIKGKKKPKLILTAITKKSFKGYTSSRSGSRSYSSSSGRSSSSSSSSFSGGGGSSGGGGASGSW